jgi:hypothetical protein
MAIAWIDEVIAAKTRHVAEDEANSANGLREQAADDTI